MKRKGHRRGAKSKKQASAGGQSAEKEMTLEQVFDDYYDDSIFSEKQHIAGRRKQQNAETDGEVGSSTSLIAEKQRIVEKSRGSILAEKQHIAGRKQQNAPDTGEEGVSTSLLTTDEQNTATAKRLMIAPARAPTANEQTPHYNVNVSQTEPGAIRVGVERQGTIRILSGPAPGPHVGIVRAYTVDENGEANHISASAIPDPWWRRNQWWLAGGVVVLIGAIVVAVVLTTVDFGGLTESSTMVPSLSISPSTSFPSTAPSTLFPSTAPSISLHPSDLPTESPKPSPLPSIAPTVTARPTGTGTLIPTSTAFPSTNTARPTSSFRPSLSPSIVPSPQPSETKRPSPSPSARPSTTARPTSTPTILFTFSLFRPSTAPSTAPSLA